MSGWIILTVAITGFIACYRISYRLIDEHEASDSDDATDRFILVTLAFLISLMWPLVLTGWAVWRVATPKTARQRRQEVQELENRRKQLERETADMERQLGIRDHQEATDG